jgi:hypothetical protein
MARRAVFISYRRADTAPWALRIADHIGETLGNERLFIDVDTLVPGEDFAKVIADTLDHCKAVIVLIGPKWLDVRSPNGARRLDDPGDFVRIEIATAYERNAEIIPVLVDGATLPSAAALPVPLRSLANEDPVGVSGNTFSYAMARLFERILKVTGRPLNPGKRGRALLRRGRAVAAKTLDAGGRLLSSTAGFLGLIIAVFIVLGLIAVKPVTAWVRRNESAPVAAAAVPNNVIDIALTQDSAWAITEGAELIRVDRATGQKRSTVKLDLGAGNIYPGQKLFRGGVAVVDDSVWVMTMGYERIVEFDLATGKFKRFVSVGEHVGATVLAAGYHEVWVGLSVSESYRYSIQGAADYVARIDTSTGALGEKSLSTGGGVLRLVVDGDQIWALCQGGNYGGNLGQTYTVLRMKRGTLGTQYPDNAGPSAMANGYKSSLNWQPAEIALGRAGLWVSTPHEIVRLDTTSGDVMMSVPFDAYPGAAIAVTDTGTWYRDGSKLRRIDPGKPASHGYLPVDQFVREFVGGGDELWLATDTELRKYRDDVTLTPT